MVYKKVYFKKIIVVTKRKFLKSKNFAMKNFLIKINFLARHQRPFLQLSEWTSSSLQVLVAVHYGTKLHSSAR